MGGALRTVAVLALCAGCFSDKGLAIEVAPGDTGATSVELYIGKDKCDPNDEPTSPKISCLSIAPPDGTIALPGTIWFRDDLLPYSAELKGGVATLHLKSDVSQSIPLMIAVGFVADPQSPDGRRAVGFAELADITIPINTAKIIDVTLVAADPVMPKNRPPPGTTANRIQVWAKHNPPSSCVVVEQWQDGHASRDFVVPAEDPDCDDVAIECNAAAFHGASTGGDPTKSECFGRPLTADRCVIGSFACTDDGGPKGTCVGRTQNESCVPSDFCTCASITDVGCLANLIDTVQSTPRIECVVPSMANASGGIDKCAGKDMATVTVPGFMPPASCVDQDPQIAALPMLTGFNGSAMFGGAEFDVSSAVAPCSFMLTWKQGTHVVNAGAADHGAIRVTSTDGTHLVIPLVLHYSDMCASVTELSCQVMGMPSDTLWTCTN